MLQISDLTKRYDDLVAVDRVSLSVARGRVVGFVGPNGAGKSTTMRSIFGLVEPDAGTISWDGQPVDHATLARFGYMPEQRGLYPKMKILDQVAFFAQLKGIDRGPARRRAGEILESLDLGDRLDEQLEKLSHGNQQRVQLAVSLVTDPELLVLDEPFNGLDPVAVTTLQEALRARVAAGTGVLFSSHQLDLVERICDELTIIVDGTIRARGAVADVRRSSGTHHLTIEVDRPAVPLAEVVEARVVSADRTRVVVEVADDAQLERVLAQARTAGPIARFDYDLPSLQDAFTRIVGGDAAPCGERQRSATEVLR